MSAKAEEALKGVKTLGNEVSAWEVRLMSLQSESQELQRRNATVKKEIESSLALAQQTLDKQRNETQAEISKIAEATKKLEADRTEFQGILMIFKKNKSEFEDEKTKILDNAKVTENLRQKLSNFVLTIRRESEFL